MRARVILAASVLFAASLTGCSLLHPHSSQPAAAPPLQTGQGELEQEAKKNQQPPPPSTLPLPAAQATPPPLPPQKQRKGKPPNRPKPQQHPAVAVAQTQQPSNNAPEPPASAIGQLTAGDSA